jgi:hypothetical protein
LSFYIVCIPIYSEQEEDHAIWTELCMVTVNKW